MGVILLVNPTRRNDLARRIVPNEKSAFETFAQGRRAIPAKIAPETSAVSHTKQKAVSLDCPLSFCNGEPSRARTCDPLIKSQLLYQLSYRPISELKLYVGKDQCQASIAKKALLTFAVTVLDRSNEHDDGSREAACIECEASRIYCAVVAHSRSASNL